MQFIDSEKAKRQAQEQAEQGLAQNNECVLRSLS